MVSEVHPAGKRSGHRLLTRCMCLSWRAESHAQEQGGPVYRNGLEVRGSLNALIPEGILIPGHDQDRRCGSDAENGGPIGFPWCSIL